MEDIADKIGLSSKFPEDYKFGRGCEMRELQFPYTKIRFDFQSSSSMFRNLSGKDREEASHLYVAG